MRAGKLPASLAPRVDSLSQACVATRTVKGVICHLLPSQQTLSVPRGWAWSALLPGWTPPITIRGGGRQQQALPKMTEKLGVCSVGVPWHWAWPHLGVRGSRAGASWQSLVRHPAIFRSTSGQLCASFASLFSPHTPDFINGATVKSQIRKAP